MQILKKACGAYATNCYILKHEKGDFIIDPGEGAFDFVRANASEVRAILNTHGHFDHIWDNEAVKEHFKVPIYIHEKDEFMLEDPFKMGHTPSRADVLIRDEKELDIAGVSFKFWLFAGHTPGCCMIELVGENLVFSGDFLFKGSIGRYDFPFSSAEAMRASLERVREFKQSWRLLPGHGEETSLEAERANLGLWIRSI